MSDLPVPVGRRTAIRAATAALFYRAAILRTRTSGAAFRRRGHTAATNAERKAAGRRAEIERLERWAAQLEAAWQADKVVGDGIDAAVLGYLLAVLGGDDLSVKELKAELHELDLLALADLDAVPGGINGIPRWSRYILGVTLSE